MANNQEALDKLQSDKALVEAALYPMIDAYKTEMLPVSEQHILYLEQSGNPSGNPVIHVHGGPGGGTDPDDRRRFDPKAYRIILFDQRGAGKSTPASCLDDNTTWDLVEDMEKIRKHLQIEKWVVFGGSWGSTLSLAYAQKYPDRVKALVLRGIFLVRREELLFFYQGPGSNFLFPDEWEKYISVIPEEERGDLMKAFNKRLTGDDAAERERAAHAWALWEMATSKLFVDPEYIKRTAKPGFADAFARIENHYFVNGCWLEDGQLIKRENIDKIRHIPTVIVQGRYDVVCPMKSAWDLHRAFPEADFKVMHSSGHSAGEAQTAKALVEATDRFRDS